MEILDLPQTTNVGSNFKNFADFSHIWKLKEIKSFTPSSIKLLSVIILSFLTIKYLSALPRAHGTRNE